MKSYDKIFKIKKKMKIYEKIKKNFSKNKSSEI